MFCHRKFSEITRSLAVRGEGAVAADAGPLLGLAPERPRRLRVERDAIGLAWTTVNPVAARHTLRLAAQRAVQRTLRALRRRLRGGEQRRLVVH